MVRVWQMLGAVALASVAVACGGQDDCLDTGAEDGFTLELDHLAEDGAWSYLVEWEGSSLLCSYLAPLDTTEVSCDGPGSAEVTVNGTVHKVSSLSLEAAPEELTFTARLEAVLVHQETLSPGYQLFQAEEGCGADWRTGSEAISF